MIHITDRRTDDIIGFFTQKDTTFNEHTQNLETYQDSFEFTSFGDHKFAHTLTDMNRVIIPAEDGGYSEYVINTARKSRNRLNLIRVKTFASYQMLSVAKVIRPTSLSAYTPSQVLGFITNDTEWRPGITESNATRTFHIENYTDPLSFLKTVANEFELEIRFRVETDGKRVTGRFIDLLERVGEWRGREITFGKDLDSIERTEDFGNIYTKLICLGPEDEDGNSLEVEVVDDDALQRWGRPHPITGELMHLEDTYEPTSDRLDMTESELRQYGRTELNKRINSSVTYEAEVVDLENVPGMANKKIRFGDTIRIKDEKFNPPLYVEARIFEQRRDIFTKSNKRVKLGDFTEYTEEDLRAVIDMLTKQVRAKISAAEMIEYTYKKDEIDGKDTQVKTDAEQDATQKAQQAISVSKDHADQVADEAETNAKQHANQLKSQIDAELLDKAGLEYVDGQLALKADSALVNTINNTVADLETTASNLNQAVNDNEVALNAQGGRITTVETDLNTVEGQLSVAITDLSSLEGTVSSQGTQISANSSAISLKANQSELDTVSGNVSDISSELNVLAGQVELKASQSALTNLANDVTQISSDVSSLQVGVNGITADVSSLESTVNGHTSDISSLNSQVDIQAGQISSKVDATYVTGAIADIEVGGRNLIVRHDEIKDAIVNAGGESSTSSEDSLIRDFIPVEPGQNLVFSQIKTVEDIGSSTNYFRYAFYDEPVMSTDNVVRREANNNETFKEIVPNGANWLRVSYYKDNKVKLEKGNKATDWTPAPEDADADISAVGTRVTALNAEVEVIAGQVELKAERSSLETVEGNVSTLSNEVGNLTVAYDGIEASISSLETTTDGLTSDISSLNTDINAVAGEVSSKVDATYVTGAISEVETEFASSLNNFKNIVPTNFNAWEDGHYHRTGAKESYVNRVRVKKLIPVKPNTKYYFHLNNSDNAKFIIRSYDENKSFVSSWGATTNATRRTTTSNEFHLGVSIFDSSAYEEKFNDGTIKPLIMIDSIEDKSFVEHYNSLTISEIDSVYSYAESEITQLAGQISLKADATTVNNINTRLSTAELDINALDGAITSKVETSTFNTLKGRVDTAESTISQQANQIQSKIDDGEARSIFTQEADSFTFDADQINFDGHVFGQDATFTGTIEGSEIIAPDIKSSESSQEFLWFNNAADFFGVGSIGAQENHSGGIRSHFLAGGGFYAKYDEVYSGVPINIGSVMFADSDGVHWRSVDMHGGTSPGMGISMLAGTGVADIEINATGHVVVGSPLYAQGFPVETVISKGSNSKGHWIEYSSGKLEVWCKPIATTCTNTSGSVYRSDVFDVDFPRNFDDSHPISVTLNVTATGRWADIVSTPSSTGCRAHQYSTVSSESNFSTFVYAVGMADVH